MRTFLQRGGITVLCQQVVQKPYRRDGSRKTKGRLKLGAYVHMDPAGGAPSVTLAGATSVIYHPFPPDHQWWDTELIANPTPLVGHRVDPFWPP